MKCLKCGKENSAYVSFCETCGSILKQASSLPIPNAPESSAETPNNFISSYVQSEDIGMSGHSKKVESSDMSVKDISDIQIIDRRTGGLTPKIQWDEYFFDCMTSRHPLR
jgi:hypothetical protein